jgi:hypothetical protein
MDWQQILTQNGWWIGPLGVLATILTWAGLDPKSLHGAIFKLRSLFSRLFKTGAKYPRSILRFVAMDFPQTHWGMGSTKDGKDMLFITIRWNVTHVRPPSSASSPAAGMPVRLLKARLLKPFGKYVIRSQVITMSAEHPNT